MFKSKIFRLIVSIFLLISLPVGVYLIQQQTHFLNEAFGISAHLYVDTGAVLNTSQGSWRNLAQGGEEKGRMIASVIPQVTRLNPNYIRLDHIYDLYNVVSRDSSGNLVFNWTDLDNYVRDILATGALPFFSLSYMPPTISSDGQIVSTPANWADWELTVQRTIEHFSGRNGMNLSGVYYEVWNEPDLFGGFKVWGPKNYLDLYSHSAAGAARAGNVNAYKFGGPAATDLYQSWFDAMFKLAGDGVRMDFFSWHKYSKDIGDYEAEMTNVRSWLANYPALAGTELIISEVGINGSIDPAYDGYLSGIQLMAMAAVTDGTVSKSFNFEIKDGPGDKQYWGRWGLLTNDKFGPPAAKPRYNALMFLNNMRGSKISVVGQGSWVKAFGEKDGVKIRLLVVNYNPWGNHAEAVPIRFDKLDNGNYSVKRIDFGGATRTRITGVTANVIDVVEGFSANTAAIFEITPQ